MIYNLNISGSEHDVTADVVKKEDVKDEQEKS
jgi:hypothetical protein